MTQASTLLKELEQEAKTTRAMLSRIPNDKYDWQPHPKSMSIRRLAAHIGELPGWIAMTLTTHELDFNANPYTQKDISSTSDLLEYFDQTLAYGKAHLEGATEEEFDKTWTLRSGDHIHSVSSKAEVIRMAYCQIVHHRAQLGVYLRLLNVPIPGSYGPSADEMNF